MNNKDNKEIHKESEKDFEKQMLLEQAEKYELEIQWLRDELIDANLRCREAQERYQEIIESESWRLTLPLQTVVDKAGRLVRRTRIYKSLCKRVGDEYEQPKFDQSLFTKAELEQQRDEIFPMTVKISIVTPLYNTDKTFLKDMIESVQDQTYANWELCLADGSDNKHKYVRGICEEYASNDERIKYRKLKENLGISGNSNACLEMVTGAYIGLLEHDDVLHPAALHEIMRAICEKDADFIYTDENTFYITPNDAYAPHFKPDFSPDSLRSCNYITHFSVFSAELLDKVGDFNSEYDGSQDYDIILRLTENARNIFHIPEILYYWRAHKESVAESIDAKSYAIDAAHRALEKHLERCGLSGSILDTSEISRYRIKYEINGNPLVSVIIPNCDHVEDLRVCIESIYEKTTYKNYEIIVAENNSKSTEIFEYYRKLQNSKANLRVITWDGEFNYSKICNFAVDYTDGDYILLLNNDTEVISPDWIQEMLMFAQREDVGAVGAKLYYPDDTIQHGGVGIGFGGLAGHIHKYRSRKDPGYMCRLVYAQNVSAVTAACMMIRRDMWNQLNGLDEKFIVAFNDVDFCLRIREAGYLIVWTPFAELYHYESKSRGKEDIEENQRYLNEANLFKKRWIREIFVGDPYLSPAFSMIKEGIAINHIDVARERIKRRWL